MGKYVAHIFQIVDAVIVLVMAPFMFRVPEHKGT
jgi:hypothetical protein